VEHDVDVNGVGLAGVGVGVVQAPPLCVWFAMLVREVTAAGDATGDAAGEPETAARGFIIMSLLMDAMLYTVLYLARGARWECRLACLSVVS
jgi:hypothetical protein